MKRKELLLCFDIPEKRGSLRVRVWRGLKETGAKNRTGSIWSLPPSKMNIQEFKRVAREINSRGGKAEVFLADVIAITKNSGEDVIGITRSLERSIKRSVIILDKPAGPTSNEVIIEIKDILGLKKAGHTGTLDPRATGVLVVALENATKLMPVLMGFDKEYEGVMYLHKDVDLERLEKTISEHFIGEITQIPPVRSSVARKPRKRKVYSFDILEKDNKNVKFKTKVEAGTYIRKLVSDLGKKLGVGAHLKELRRTKVGHFNTEDCHSLEEIKQAQKAYEKGDGKPIKKILIPIEDAIPHVKRVYVKDSSLGPIRDGAPISAEDIVRSDPGIEAKERVGIFSSKNKLIALGISKMSSENIPKKGRKSVIRTDRAI